MFYFGIVSCALSKVILAYSWSCLTASSMSDHISWLASSNLLSAINSLWFPFQKHLPQKSWRHLSNYVSCKFVSYATVFFTPSPRNSPSINLISMLTFVTIVFLRLSGSTISKASGWGLLFAFLNSSFSFCYSEQQQAPISLSIFQTDCDLI